MAALATVEGASANTLSEVLNGAWGVGALRELAAQPLCHGLGELLEECFPGASQATLRLLRSKYKPGRKLTAYYGLSITRTAVQRNLAVSWSALGASPPDRPIALLVSPADPAMTQAARLSDTAHVASLVERLTSRPVEPPASMRLRIVRYRPGQRHVWQAEYGAGSSGVVVKTDRDDCGRQAVPLAEALGPILGRRCPGAALAQPVGYCVEDRAAVWRLAPGEVLARLIASQPTKAVDLTRFVGRAVRTLHDITRPSGDGPDLSLLVGSHDTATEAASTLRAGEHIAALLPSVAQTYAALAGGIMEGLARWPEEPPTVSHGDLKSENILVQGQHVRLLDLDRCAWAEPALDLGKFLADLRWWVAATPAALRVLDAAFREGYGPCDRVRWARADLLAALFQLKFAARRCMVHDRFWASEVRQRVGQAARAAVAAGRA